MSIKSPFVAALLAGMLVAPAAMAASGRDYVSVVGSSTVYPFTTTVAEQFGRATRFKTPKVESTIRMNATVSGSARIAVRSEWSSRASAAAATRSSTCWMTTVRPDR